MPRRYNGKRTGQRSTRQVQPVAIVDANDSADQLKISRVFSNMDSSLSLVNTVLEANASLNIVTSGATTQQVTFPSFTSTTDFSAFAGEYKLFRIKAIQFDVYDTQPNNTGTCFWSSQHFGVGATNNVTLGSVTAALDVGIVPPGAGQKTWTWVAKGTTELGWQATNGTIYDYGGLTAYSPAASTAATNRYYIVARAHTQFKARV